MNDTITLVLHDLEKHEQIVNLLRIMTSGYRKLDNQKNGGTLRHEVTVFDDSDKYTEKFIYRSSIQPSSHYKVIFTVNTYKDCIQFNFSIPKYFYGNNIVQNVLNANEVQFSMINNSIDYAIDNGFERLQRYIKTFFDNEFSGVKIYYSLLELKRLDFCYNQIFRSKSDAFEYLELQRNIRKKHLREDSTKSNNYSTSIMYYNKDYSVKIYHKGSEFAKNDSHELLQVNKKNTSVQFDVDYLQNFADRILRYEITIRPSYMSYLFNQNIFRKNSKQFNTWKKLYNKIKAKHKQLENKKFVSEIDKASMYETIYNDFKNKIDKSTNLPIFDYLYYHYNETIPTTKLSLVHVTRLMNKFYKDFDVLRNTRRQFFFKLDKETMVKYQHDNLTNDNKFDTIKYVPFTNDLYKLMNNKLMEFIKDMAVEQKKSLTHYLKEVDSYNQKIDSIRDKQKGINMAYKIKTDSKIDKPKIGMILCALENYDITDLCNIIGFDRKTLYRYKSQLKKIGFTKNTIDKCSIPVPELSFKDYYIESMLNSKKLFINQFFTLKYNC